MNDLEDRLRDAFAVLDRQVVVPPMRTDVPVRSKAPLAILAAAAAVVVAVFAVASFVDLDTDDDIGVASEVSPAAFDAHADAACRDLRINSGRPGFNTLDAYRVVSELRLERIAILRASLLAVPPPADDPSLLDTVTRRLDAAVERTQHVLDLVAVGRLDGLPDAWSVAHRYLDLTFQVLFDHGAEECVL